MNIYTRADYPYRAQIGRGKVVHAAGNPATHNSNYRACICGYAGDVGYDCTDLPPETPITCKVCLREWEVLA